MEAGADPIAMISSADGTLVAYLRLSRLPPVEPEYVVGRICMGDLGCDEYFELVYRDIGVIEDYVVEVDVEPPTGYQSIRELYEQLGRPRVNLGVAKKGARIMLWGDSDCPGAHVCAPVYSDIARPGLFGVLARLSYEYGAPVTTLNGGTLEYFVDWLRGNGVGYRIVAVAGREAVVVSAAPPISPRGRISR